MITKNNIGVRPVLPDRRDRHYDHHATFGASFNMLPGLPKEGLGRTPLDIKDQGQTNYCTGTEASAAEYPYGIAMSFEWQVAKIGQLSGGPIYGGADPRVALSSRAKFGSLPKSASPLTFERDGWEKPADWKNYPATLDAMAEQFKGSCYYPVTFGHWNDFDAFDSARLALWIAREEHEVITAYGFWFDEWNRPLPGGIAPMPGSPIARHHYLIIDFKEIGGVQYLVVQNSEGASYGDHGLLYVNRQAFNKAWKNPYWNGIALWIWRETPGLTVELMKSRAYGAVDTFLDFMGGLAVLAKERFAGRT